MPDSRKKLRKQSSPGAARSKNKSGGCSQTGKTAYTSKALALEAAGPGEDAERCARDRSHFHVVRKRGKGRNR